MEMDYLVSFEDGSSGYLSHYGIKGMKWGVWNAETRARRNGWTTDSDGFSSSGGGFIDEELEKQEEENEEQREENERYIKEHPELFPMIEDGKNNPDSCMLAANVGLQAINFKKIFGVRSSFQDELDHLTNCASCSIAYDLRRRGYNVSAGGTENASHLGNADLMSQVYKNAEMDVAFSLTDAHNNIDKLPNGARGYISGKTVNNTSHAIAWEKENGKVIYRDCQLNKKYSSLDEVRKNVFTENNMMRYVRFDNREPNLSSLMQRGIVSPTPKGDYKSEASKKIRENSGSKVLERETNWLKEDGGIMEMLSGKKKRETPSFSEVVKSIRETSDDTRRIYNETINSTKSKLKKDAKASIDKIIKKKKYRYLVRL